ncbi:putative LIM/homeobox protein Lhx6 [Trichinella spiralis]|uniref:putative LIM/homeobox protein Lhx6 n=1 Tax=Trichinella spiralis TaxID=6334 RepID=UPI0001EFE746|nr:putative LIM/homeobox protein Lhx6 [Trichinella spiralis]
MYLPKAAFSQIGFRERCPGVPQNIVTRVPRDKKLHVGFREDKIVEKRWPKAINSAINVCHAICVRCNITRELLNIKSSCSMQQTFTAMQYFSRKSTQRK